MIWMLAWLAAGFLTGIYLVFSSKGGGRVSLSLGDWMNGLATDLGWLVFITIAGPLPAIFVLVVLLRHFILSFQNQEAP